MMQYLLHLYYIKFSLVVCVFYVTLFYLQNERRNKNLLNIIFTNCYRNLTLPHLNKPRLSRIVLASVTKDRIER